VAGARSRAGHNSTLATRKHPGGPVEDEPDEPSEAIEDLLDDAERIVDEAEPDVVRQLEDERRSRRKWWQPWKRTRPEGGDDWHLSSR
jgi:hypothetical protein